MWHASISRRASLGPYTISTNEWTPEVRAQARSRLFELLADVGGGMTVIEVVEPQRLALHMKRALTEAEVATLDPVWCEIAPRDESGGTIIERIGTEGMR